MGEAPIKLENILEQASKWTFAGDFTLLQWMKQISQDLENRGIKTTEALTKLENNVKSTNISLDNVANSLTTLQFGNQFVECRVQDDDDIHVNTNEASRDNQKDPELTATSKEMLNIFLENNLKVLRNCYEKYSIDLEDSDDEEISKEKTCIYKPINPYNERPLPFIFGSKDWHSKWHVGLYENQQENSYSGDEISEEFSESSSASHLGDNESFESNTEWASSNSIENDHLNANIEIKNASSLRGSESLYPGTHISINDAKNKATIDESSSTSSSLAKNPLISIKRNEHLTQRSESINSISSKSSSKNAAKVSTVNQETTSQYKPQPQKFVDLFEEPPEDLESLKFSSSTLNKIAAADDNQSLGFHRTSAYRTQPTSFVDLFAEPPDDIKSFVSSNQNVKRKPINIFEEDENDNAEDDLLSVSTKGGEFEKPENNTLIQDRTNVTNKPSAVSNISTSLFDDSDDDDDFLKAFLKRSSDKEATKSTLSKTLFFDNEVREPTISSILLTTDVENGSETTSKEKHFNNKIQNIFDDNGNNGEDLLFHQTKKDESKFQMPNPEQQVKTSVSVTKLQAKSAAKENVRKSVNLFHDFDDVPKIDNSNEDKIAKSKNLFDDLDDENLFSTKPKRQSEVFQQPSILDVRKQSGFMENEEKSCDVSQDTAILEASYSKDNNPLDNKEYNNKSKQIVAGDHTIEQTIASEIIENKLDTKFSKEDNDLIDKEQLFEAPNQKDENKNNATTIMPDTSALDPENIIPQPSSSNNYEFNSVLFLDEPPEDDNEFFETLAKAPNTLSSNYNTIDLENDVYEPELPKVPVASTSNNQTDTSDNFYTGLQLFSDIPPDDDPGSSSEISTLPPDTHKTNRLHSVFYDDFNETLMALNLKHAEKEISSNHSVFSEEPPPMNEEELNSISKDIMSHGKVPDNKQDITYVEHKTERLGITTPLEQPLNESSTQFSNKRPVSKLQMPDININIQALLPEAKISIRKAKESNNKTNIFNSYQDQNQDDTQPTLNISKETVTENENTASTVEIPRTSETKHILPNLTKNRVKASSARRPSTRKARQESYRKSLLEQQQTLEGGDENIAIENQNAQANIIQAAPRQMVAHEQYPENTINVKDNVFGAYEGNYGIKEKYLESSSRVQNNKNPTSSLLLNKKEDDQNLSSFKQVKSINESSKNNEANIKTEQKRSLLFFADEEEDDDFFKHITASQNIEANVEIKSKGKQETATTKSPAETVENNASSSSAHLANSVNAMTKEIRVLPSIDAEFPSAVVQSVTSTEEYKKQQPLKETENIFNNFDVSGTSNVKSTKKISNESKSFLDEEDDDDDLFKSPLQQQTKWNKNKERINKAKSQFKSFLDSESEEELTVAGLQKGITTQSIRVSSVNTPMPKNSNAKLFANSESDSDDLFKNISSSKTSNNKISSESISKTQTKGQPQPSLFGDESDSDNFLTHSGSANKHTVPKNAIKKNEPKTTTQTNASLFSDLDSDEDDLFGSGAAKVTTSNVINITNVKASTISKPTAAVVDISKSKSVDDNPLADLL